MFQRLSIAPLPYAHGAPMERSAHRELATSTASTSRMQRAAFGCRPGARSQASVSRSDSVSRLPGDWSADGVCPCPSPITTPLGSRALGPFEPRAASSLTNDRSLRQCVSLSACPLPAHITLHLAFQAPAPQTAQASALAPPSHQPELQSISDNNHNNNSHTTHSTHYSQHSNSPSPPAS